MYDPKEDGITHINVYSKGETELGRLMSNFANTPIHLKEDGEFASIEAYWYWLSAPEATRDELRPLYGYMAKKKGRELRGQDWVETADFQEKIQQAIWNKIKRHKRLRELLRESSLPFVHYYSFGTPPRINEPRQGKWIWAFYEKARTYLKEHPEL